MGLLVVAGCDNSLVCGEGTHEEGEACVADEAPRVDNTAPPDEPDDDDTAIEPTEPAEDPTIEDVLDALPACEPAAADGRIDLTDGCADGACAGMTLAELEGALGEQGACMAFDPEDLFVFCAWQSGISVFLNDLDGDGLADDDAVASSIRLDPPYDGSTDQGLGIPLGWGCYVDALGMPDNAGFFDLGNGLELFFAGWSAAGVSATADFNGSGEVASLSVSGGIPPSL